MISEVGQVFNDPTLNSLKLSLEVASARHEALASNVANMNTPGYRRVDLTPNFKQALSSALERLDKGESPSQINLSAPSFGVDPVQNNPRMDGNTVNVEQEMGELIKNQTDFDFSSRMLALKYSALHEAISGNVT